MNAGRGAMRIQIDNLTRVTRSAFVFLLYVLFSTHAAFGAGEVDLSRPDGPDTPTAVTISFYLADMFEISGADQAFTADVVVIAQWRDSRLAGRWPTTHHLPTDGLWTPNLQLLNYREVSAILPQRVEVQTSGDVQWRQRWSGRFAQKMDLRDFPLDRQQFHVQAVTLGYTKDEVTLILDQHDAMSGRARQLSITDWDVGPVGVRAADFEPAPGTKVLAGVELWWEAKRYVGYYAVQVVLPLALIVLMGCAVFWVDPSATPARVSISMTTMLTLIAYRFSLGKSVPNLTYLTRFDSFMLGSTILVFCILLVVVAGAHLTGEKDVERVKAMDRWASVAFPLLFACTFVLSWWG